ncbi:MAG: hypothetical protein WBE80_00020, partial [Methylocella sp.]
MILARLEGIGDQFAIDVRKYMSAVRAENEELREAIFSALTDRNCSPAGYAATGRGFPARVRRIAAIARMVRRRAVSITERIPA